MFAPVLLVLASALVVTPEIQLAPPRLGPPRGRPSVSRVIPMGDGFLVGQGSDGFGFTTALDAEARPTKDELIPSPLGLTLAVASSGGRALAIEHVPARIVLTDAEGRIERVAFEMETAVSVSQRSVLWTGEEFVVAWTDVPSRAVRAMRLSGDGTRLSGPFAVTTILSGSPVAAPFLASDGRDVLLSVLSGEQVLIFRVDADQASPVQVMKPAQPRIADFLHSSGSFFLLLNETADGFSVYNIYRVTSGGELAHATWIPAADWRAPGLLDLEDGVLVYGQDPPRPLQILPREIVVQRFSSEGAPVSPRTTAVRTAGDLQGVTATRRNHVIAFVWDEESSGVKVAAVDTAFTGASVEHIPVARGASRRTAPAVAAANGATLSVWTETTAGRSFVAGTLRTREGASFTLEIADRATSPHIATDGSSFLVAWRQYGTGLFARIVRSDGRMEDAVSFAGQRGDRPRLAWSGEDYVVVWHEITTYPFVQRDGAIFARALDAQGNVLGPAPQRLASGSEPAISASSDRLLVAWTSGTTCDPIVCAPMARLSLHGQILGPSLEPVSPSFILADDPNADEINAAAASSDDGWLVAWTAMQADYVTTPDFGRVAKHRSVIRHATISSGGFVQRLFQPPLDDPSIVDRNPAVAWTGEHYVLLWEGAGLRARRLMPDGSPASLEDVLVSDSGMDVAAAGMQGGAAIVYERRTPERLIGAAEQVFLRFMYDGVKRRAASRKP